MIGITKQGLIQACARGQRLSGLLSTISKFSNEDLHAALCAAIENNHERVVEDLFSGETGKEIASRIAGMNDNEALEIAIKKENSKIIEQLMSEEKVQTGKKIDIKKFKMRDLINAAGLINQMYSEEEMISEINSRMIHSLDAPLLEFGPLNQSEYTKKIMEITADLLNDDIVDGYMDKESIILVYSDGSKIDLSEYIKHMNLAHIHFPLPTQDESEAQAKYSMLHEKYKTYAYEKFNQSHRPSVASGEVDAQHFRDIDINGEFAHLSDAEIAAINIYTSPYYNNMSDFLEGTMSSSYDFNAIRDVFLNTMFCASGLNKIPFKTYQHAFRGSSASHESLDKKKKLAENGSVIYEKGFISSTYGKTSGFLSTSALIFTDGILGQDISLISGLPHEKEILMNPTQIQYLGYAEEDGKIFFLVKPVRTLSGLTPDFQLQNQQAQIEDKNEKKEEESQENKMSLRKSLTVDYAYKQKENKTAKSEKNVSKINKPSKKK